MCGRTACTLDKGCIQRATREYSLNEDIIPWIQKYEWQNYKPSYNISPSQITPVIVNDEVMPVDFRTNNYVLTPMRWGFIPSWYKGQLENYALKTNNCRIENLLEKPTYKGAAIAGYRCVILADGFYEWKAGIKNQKQPYFIHFPQNKGPEIFTEQLETDDQNYWCGLKLLTMAGLFDIWKSPQKEVIYSYSVITMDSSKTVSFVHERMPAILESKDQVSLWLDSRRTPIKEALKSLKPTENLQMYPVSTLVSNSRNNSVDCLKEIKLQEKPALKSTLLTSWLTKGNSSKRLKTDATE